MKTRTLRLLTTAWWRSIVRDRATLFWFFAFPILFIVIFGLAFGSDTVGPFKVGLAADTGTPAGAALSQAFGSVKAFKMSTGTRDALVQKLKDGDLDAAVVVAPASTPAAGPAGGDVTIYLDPSRGTSEQIIRPIIVQVVSEVDTALSGRAHVLTVEEQSVRGGNLAFIDFFLPGVIGFSIMQSGMFAAIPLVQLRESRMLKRFGATPVSRVAVLLSQGIARLVLAVLQTAVLLAIGRGLYGVHISANWPGIVVLVLLGSAVFLLAGFAISGLGKSEESVPALVQVFSFPMMFLAGVFWPVENFPSFIQPLSKVLPLTFLGDGLRQAMVGGAALNPLPLDALALLGWGAVCLVAAIRLFKWE